jgi:uncharacterized membrane protein HdeD (DUF308 family)
MVQMDTQQAKQVFRQFWVFGVILGSLSVILGIAMVEWPGPSIVVASIFLGVYLVVSGVTQVVLAVSLPVASTGGRVLLLLSGAASIILAVLAFRHFGEGHSVLLLAIWIGIAFIMRGVSALAAAISDPLYPSRGWAIVFSAITAIGGIAVLAYPVDSIVTLTYFVGFWLIVIGAVEIISGFGLRHDIGKANKVVDATAA